MNTDECNSCRYNQRIRGQQTHICVNKALVVINNKKKNKEKTMDDLCNNKYHRPLTLWQRLKYKFFGVAANELQPKQDQWDDYITGEWNNVPEKENQAT